MELRLLFEPLAVNSDRKRGGLVQVRFDFGWEVNDIDLFVVGENLCSFQSVNQLPNVAGPCIVFEEIRDARTERPVFAEPMLD